MLDEITSTSKQISISLNFLSREVRRILIFGALSINIIIVLIFVIFYCIYAFKPFEGKRSKIFSYVIMSYNSILVIPIVLVSVQEILKDNYYMNYCSLACLFLTLMISIICSLHSGMQFQLLNSDSLAKLGSFWDNIKYTIIIFFIVVIEILKTDFINPFFTILFSITNITDSFFMNLHFEQTVSRLFITLNILIFSGSVASFSNYEKDLEKTIFICLLIAIPLSWLFSKQLIDFSLQILVLRVEKLKQSKKNSQNRNYLSQRDGDYIMMFEIKRLIEGSYLKPTKKRYQQAFNISDDKLTKDASFSLNNLKEESEEYEIQHIKNQVKQLSKLTISRRLNSVNQSNRCDTISSTLPLLFYLLEIEKNYIQLAIKNQEFLKEKQCGLIEKSAVNYLEIEMKLKMEQKIETKIGKNYKEQVNHQNLAISVMFEVDIQELSQNVAKAIHLKVHFLSVITKDTLDLEIVRTVGIQFLIMCVEISEKILIMKNQSIHCKELIAISNIFLEHLWLDPKDQPFRFYQESSRVLDNKQTRFIESLKQYKTIDKINYNKLTERQCTLFVQLNTSSLGIISKASNSCFKVTGFYSTELLGKNCNILQPISIAINHNIIIRNGIENGFPSTLKDKDAPLILKRKDGLGVRVQLDFQTYLLGSISERSEIGIVTKISIDEKNDEETFFLIDIARGKSVFEVVSEQAFQIYFSNFLTYPLEINGVDAKLIIPVLQGITNYMEEVELVQVDIETLVFFPIPFNEQSIKRMFDSSTPLLDCFLQNYFNPWTNNIYIMSLRVQHYNKSQISLVQVQINSAIQIQDIDILKQYKINNFLPQLIQYKVIPLSHISEIQKIIRSNFQNSKQVVKYNIINQENRQNSIKARSFRKNSLAISYNQNYPKETKAIEEEESRNNTYQPISEEVEFTQEYKRQQEDPLPTKFFSPRPVISQENLLQNNDFVKIKNEFLDIINTPIYQTVKEQLITSLDPQQNNTNIESSPTHEKHDTIYQASDQYASSQQSTSSYDNRSTLLSYLFQFNYSKLERIVMTLVFALFLGILLQSCITFQQLQREINSHSLNSEFYWWLNQSSLKSTSILKFQSLLFTINMKEAVQDLTSEEIAYKNNLPFKIQENYKGLLKQFIRINKNGYYNLDLERYLFNYKLNFTLYSTISQKNNFTLPFYLVTTHINFLKYQLTISKFLEQKVIDYQISTGDVYTYSVYKNISSNLRTDQSNRSNYINYSTLTSWIIILCISVTVVLLVLYVYTMSQTKKQFILSLFNSIEQRSIETMHSSALQAYQLLENIQATYRSNDQIKSNIIKKATTFSPVYLKKRVNIPTTSLSKFNKALFTQLLIFILTINAQPLTNVFLIRQQLKETETQQDIVNSLFAVQLSLFYNEYALLQHFQKVYSPNFSYMPPIFFEMYLSSSLTTLEILLQTAQLNINNFISSQYQNLAQNLLVINIFSKNICSSLDDYVSDHPSIQYKSSDCNSLFGGVLKEGYISATKSISIRLNEYSEILLASQKQSSNLDTLIQSFFKRNPPMQIDNFNEIINTAASIVQNHFSQMRNNLYDSISLIQLSLFLFEILFLACIFFFTIYPFFRRLKSETSISVYLLSILQVNQILDNAYIINYVKTEANRW